MYLNIKNLLLIFTFLTTVPAFAENLIEVPIGSTPTVGSETSTNLDNNVNQLFQEEETKLTIQPLNLTEEDETSHLLTGKISAEKNDSNPDDINVYHDYFYCKQDQNSKNNDDDTDPFDLNDCEQEGRTVSQTSAPAL